MKTVFVQYKRVLMLVCLCLILLTGCYEFESIDQPDICDPNSAFDVHITVRTEWEAHDVAPLFGILLPDGWLVEDSISCSGVYNGSFSYSSEQSDSMEALHSAPDGYYWWVAVGSYADTINSGTCSATPRIQTSGQTGTFFIDYMLGYDEFINYCRSNDHPISLGMPMAVEVTNTNDSGEASLRQAMADVSSSGEITFDLIYPATITLDSQLIVDRNLTITGPTSEALTISGNNSVRVFSVNGNLNVNMSNLTISDGNAGDLSGGGIYVKTHGTDVSSGVLTLANCKIRGSNANRGGGICDLSCSPTLVNVTISENTADIGGAIYCSYSNLSLANVTVKENRARNCGGGIYCYTSSPNFDELHRCNIFLNFAPSGNDLYASNSNVIDVIVDTFTVLHPDDAHAYPVASFSFDMLNAKIEQVSQDLYVSPTGSNDNSGLTPDDPLLTISYALMKSVADSTNPQTIHLANGTYSPSLTGEIFPLFCRSYLSIEGDDDVATILDGEKSSNILFYKNVFNSSLRDLTIRNGIADEYGGGIYCRYSSPTLTNVTISANVAPKHGGGIHCRDNSNLSLTNVTISENSADFGGGIACWGESNPSLANVTICGNFANQYGGGMSCWGSSSPSLTNVAICGNCATNYGGGLHCSNNSNPSLTNVTISENITSQAGGGIHCSDNSSPSLTQVTICGDSADFGGGISCWDDSSPSLFKVDVKENAAREGGGGICCKDNSKPSLANVTISENTAGSFGGGLYCWGENASPNLINVTISENTSLFGGGIYCSWLASPKMLNCVLWNDSPQEVYFCGSGSPSSLSISYSDVQGDSAGIVTNNNGILNWLDGNINADPRFRDPHNSDFHLMATEYGYSYDSPCIDAGDPNILDSVLDSMWGLGSTRSDMGAYGGGDSVEVGVVDHEQELQAPKQFALSQNYPNPFNPTTVLNYSLPQPSQVTLSIYNILGQRVKTLYEGLQPAGEHSVTWNAADFPSGIYFAQLEAGAYSKNIKMVLVR